MIYDHTTKQRRYMSPFEQFIAEQEGLFKKDELRQHDEQNSVSLTTTASTNFNDTKTVVISSLRSGSGSVVEEPIPLLPKKPSQVMKPNNKLAKKANVMKYDAQVKLAEDEVMMERRENLKQLRSIKGYLKSAKTAKNLHIAQRVKEMAKVSTSSSSQSSRSFLSFLFA